MQKEMSRELIGTILVILTAIFSGFNIVANKYFLAAVDPLILTAIRGLMIGILFLFISLVVANKDNGQFKHTSWKNLLLIGIIGGGIAFWMFFSGLKLTLASRAAFIHKTLPIYATILAVIFLKEKVSKRTYFALILMLCGLFIMESQNLTFDLRIGDLLVLGATILWAVENTIAKKSMIQNENNFVVVFSRMFFGSIVLFGIIFLFGKQSLLMSLNSKQWTYILISGGLLTMYVLTYYWGLKHIKLSKASTILLLAPVITLILSITWLGEKASLLQLIGSFVILIGSYLVIREKN